MAEAIRPSKKHSPIRQASSGSITLKDSRAVRQANLTAPAPINTKSWAEVQVCDAISCTPVGRSLPPHLGSAYEPPPTPGSTRSRRIPWSRWMNSKAKNHFVAALGEVTGTTMFLFLAFAGAEIAVANSLPGVDEVIKLLYISICFGFSLMVNAWIFFRISGALFNPAVTLAMLIVGAVGPVRALCLFVAQLAGSIAASAMALGIFPLPLRVNTMLSSNCSHVRGMWIEAFLTAELIFTILMLAKEKHRSTYMAPVGIGLALFISQLVGVYYTGASMNPARTFGPAVITHTWEVYHWIYWVGPIIGALIAVAFYKFIKLLEYEMANPGQDADVAHDPKHGSKFESSQPQRNSAGSVLSKLGIDPLVHKHKVADEESVATSESKEALTEPQTPVRTGRVVSPIVKPQAAVGSPT